MAKFVHASRLRVIICMLSIDSIFVPFVSCVGLATLNESRSVHAHVVRHQNGASCDPMMSCIILYASFRSDAP